MSSNVRLAGSVVIVLLGWVFFGLPLGESLRHLSYDWAFFFRPACSMQEIEPALILYLDDDSHRYLKQEWFQRWDRNLFATALERLTALGARAVVFDVLLDVPQDPATDQRLVDAAQRHGRALFASRVVQHTFEGAAIGFRLEEPFTNALRSGVVEVSTPDREVRQHYRDTMQQLPSLAWQAAQLTTTHPLTDPARARWVNYYGPPGTIPHDSFYRLISNTLPAGLVSNKVVFIGARYSVGFTGGMGTDNYRTPYTPWSHMVSPGTEINATTYLNLVRGDWLEEVPWGVGLLLVTLCGFALGYGLPAFRPWPATGIVLAAAILVTAIAVGAVWLTHAWFAWLFVCGVQLPVAFAWSILASMNRLYLENDALKTRATHVKDTPASSQPPPPFPRPAHLYPGPPPPMPDATKADIPPPVPDHTLLRAIGQGAYGQVWLARDAIGTFHAVKFLFRQNFQQTEPFEREFRGIQKFTPISRTHPNFVHILHVGRNEEAGYFYYIMELGDDEDSGAQIDPDHYVPKNLARELRRRGRLSAVECVEVALALTEALDHLHRHHLIHRDIKPSNIIFVRGIPKLADIGLVTDIAATGQDISYLGTQGYIAPEGPGSPAADVYSLGRVLYEASTGMDRARFPELPSALMDSPDRTLFFQLNKVILKACEIDPHNRYRSAAAMRDELLQVQRHQKIRRRWWFGKAS